MTTKPTRLDPVQLANKLATLGNGAAISYWNGTYDINLLEPGLTLSSRRILASGGAIDAALFDRATARLVELRAKGGSQVTTNPTLLATASDTWVSVCWLFMLLPTGTMCILGYLLHNEALPNDWPAMLAALGIYVVWMLSMWIGDHAKAERSRRNWQRYCAKHGTISRINP